MPERAEPAGLDSFPAKPGPTERSGVNPALGIEGDLKVLRKQGIRILGEKRT